MYSDYDEEWKLISVEIPDEYDWQEYYADAIEEMEL